MTISGSTAPSVLVVINNLRLGGAERMLERLVVALGVSGRVRFTVCSLEDVGPIGQRLESRGIEVIALRLRGGSARVALAGIFGVRRILRGRRFDVIHSVLYRSHVVSRFARLGLRPRVSLVSSEHCVGHNRNAAIRFVNRLTGAMSDRVLTVSRAVADDVVGRDGVPASKVAVVPNGVEQATPSARERSRLRHALGIADSEVAFLYLGRLHHEKGPDVLVSALEVLHRLAPGGWRMLIVGEGPERAALTDRIAALHLREMVILPGGRRRVEPWLNAADIMVSPSREEGMPVAVLEAMIHGKAVVATAVGGTPEVVTDTVTGLLVDPENPEGLAAAMLRLLSEPETRRAMGERGRARAHDSFTVEQMAERTLREYDSIMTSARPGRAEAAAAGKERY